MRNRVVIWDGLNKSARWGGVIGTLTTKCGESALGIGWNIIEYYETNSNL